MVCNRMGDPSSSMNCLRLVPAFSGTARPMRVPKPAAGRITETFIAQFTGRAGSDTRAASFRRLRSRGLRLMLARRALRPFRMAFVVDSVHPLVEPAEYHFTGRGLQDAGDGNVDGAGDHLLGVVHHHHGAVVQVGHALVVLLAFLQNEDPHGLARQHDGLQRVGQLVDVQHLHAVQLRHFIEIEIVGDDLAVVDLGQLDQLHVHFRNVGEIILQNLDVELRHLLDASAGCPGRGGRDCA